MGWFASIPDTVRRCARLSALEWRYLGLAIALLPAAVLAHRRVGIRTLESVAARVVPPPWRATTRTMRAAAAHRAAAARMVRVAAERIWLAPNCLQRALLTWWLLACHGVESELWLGARRAGAGLEGHAWLAYDGQALTDPGDKHGGYQPMTRLFAHVTGRRR